MYKVNYFIEQIKFEKKENTVDVYKNGRQIIYESFHFIGKLNYNKCFVAEQAYSDIIKGR